MLLSRTKSFDALYKMQGFFLTEPERGQRDVFNYDSFCKFCRLTLDYELNGSFQTKPEGSILSTRYSLH